MKFIITLIVLFSSCSTRTSFFGKIGSWEEMGYKEFSIKINEMSGNDSIDCGFYDLIESRANLNGATEDKGYYCARDAPKQGVPFKYGTKNIPIDSYVFEILYSTPEKEYWLVTLDIMLGGGDIQQWNKKCKNILFRNKSYKGVDCEIVHYKEWIKLK